MKTDVKTKKCNQCHKDKLIDDFSFRTDTNTYRHSCKKCISEYKKTYRIKNKEKISQYMKNYRNKNHDILTINKNKHYENNKISINKNRNVFFKNNPWIKTLYRIKSRCTNTNLSDYKYYGGRGIKCLITEDELKKLWFRDKAHNMKRPSIDREDNDGDYIYDNCQFIEHIDNIKKAHNKIVLQYDLNGNFIKEWESVMTIQHSLGYCNTGIGKCCLNKANSSYGFVWRYK